MRWNLAAGCILLGVVALVCGQEAAEIKPSDIVKETLEIMEKISKQLAAVKDEDSAKAARSELKSSVTRWLEMRKRAEKLKPPASKAERDRLDKEFRGKLVNANKKLRAEIARVDRVPGGRDALKELVNLILTKKKSK
ncbi:MAG: hypothetical protein FJ271_03060 [Planctomycetes bacterium]|nr:hypothetical protein [Planctomycetota bacterium]